MVPWLCGRVVARASGECWDDHDAIERVEDLAGPGPVAGQPELSAAAAADESGGVQHFESQELRFGGGLVTGEGEQPEPAVRSAAIATSCSHVSLILNSREGNRPRPVSLAALMRSSTRAWGAVPSLQEGELAGGGVGGEGLVAPAVGLLQQRQLRARMGLSSSRARTRPCWSRVRSRACQIFCVSGEA